MQVFFDILEEANITAQKLCKILEEHDILLMQDKPKRCVPHVSVIIWSGASFCKRCFLALVYIVKYFYTEDADKHYFVSLEMI